MTFVSSYKNGPSSLTPNTHEPTVLTHQPYQSIVPTHQELEALVFTSQPKDRKYSPSSYPQRGSTRSHTLRVYHTYEQHPMTGWY
jgi:hypothetical protein